ncbi:hypothetical protein [Flavihumibacter profundi]|uniref:hypothetical protein n=1 Tax=Flavihumibacter profundi TaxID=2716883 RepID=UPI001CC4B422|nr:hypothetical protein [Flavihumibacter profundi]MBZ5857699.1 hypothetical protein [Flavihumibacter profundi]
MKRIPAMLAVPVVVLLFSCNNQPPKEETKSADTTVAVTSPAPPVEAKPVFTPFKVVIIQQKVKDFEKSMADYFKRDSLRQPFGITHFMISRNAKDSNTVFVIDKIEDMDKAKAFYAQPGLKEAMKKAGVSSPPAFTYAEMVRSSDAPLQYTDGIAVTHHVKDYSAWLKVFDAEGAATRSANGLIDRGIARDLNDSNTVSILFEVSDMAKAKARMSSPELKKIMTDAGVDSPPTTRLYKVIK